MLRGLAAIGKMCGPHRLSKFEHGPKFPCLEAKALTTCRAYHVACSSARAHSLFTGLIFEVFDTSFRTELGGNGPSAKFGRKVIESRPLWDVPASDSTLEPLEKMAAAVPPPSLAASNVGAGNVGAAAVGRGASRAPRHLDVGARGSRAHPKPQRGLQADLLGS